MQYQLKIQQLVTYAKSRVYRNFIRALSDNENIRMNGESNLFYFMTLCSYANFRTSTFRIDAMRYTLAPGEWMMPVRELMKIYRKKTEKGTVAVLERLQQSNHIHYELLHHRRYVKFRINDWSKFNSTIEATAPCTK
ncbi:MAG: MarR family transcriptional regulator, partial [Clostridia bacterium]|nr:MarR family transcriptional regulator [Clostridia bacterium]